MSTFNASMVVLMVVHPGYIPRGLLLQNVHPGYIPRDLLLQNVPWVSEFDPPYSCWVHQLIFLQM
ncbi:hypothetical protein [Salmonella sp. s51933]|uniref:hypothetical protein n=1 Tax=Salmonella sp. s51933 TaxID=3160127 RepID=UPI0037553BA2